MPGKWKKEDPRYVDVVKEDMETFGEQAEEEGEKRRAEVKSQNTKGDD